MVFFIGRVIAWLVPDIPESVEVKVKRERYLAKEALAENKVGCSGSSTPFFKAFFGFKLAQRRRRARRQPCKELRQLLLV